MFIQQESTFEGHRDGPRAGSEVKGVCLFKLLLQGLDQPFSG